MSRPMNIDQVLGDHKQWLNGDVGSKADLREADLREADLREADLRWADLRKADLRWANLRGADLRGADLRKADLRWANLRGADLRGADLRKANLDFAAWPLWRGTFDVIADDRLVCQLAGHIARLNVEHCSDTVRVWVAAIPPEIANDICKRHDVEPVSAALDEDADDE
jgi:hypothetical protein